MMAKRILSFVLVCFLILPLNLSAEEGHGAQLKIKKTDGQQVSGELITVKENSILILNREGADVTLDINDIVEIKIMKISRFWRSAGWGLLIGTGSGVLFGAKFCDWFGEHDCPPGEAIIIFGIVGAGSGSLIGGTWGAITGIDKTIRIEGKSDSEIQVILNSLRKKARIQDYQ